MHRATNRLGPCDIEFSAITTGANLVQKSSAKLNIERTSIAVHDFEGPDAGRIAVLVPCYNEEIAVAKVVKDFHRALTSTVFVYDNNSTDGTASVAGEAGAVVFQERHQGEKLRRSPYVC